MDKAIEGLENKDGENRTALDAEIAALKKADEDNKKGVDAEVVALKAKDAELDKAVISLNQTDLNNKADVDKEIQGIRSDYQPIDSINSKSVFASKLKDDKELISKGYKLIDKTEEQAWKFGSNRNQPSSRLYHAAAWGRNKLFVWGGKTVSGGESNNGGIYHSDLDKWNNINNINAPLPRSFHTANYLENNFIIWGGMNKNGHLQNGGIYDIENEKWSNISKIGEPKKRKGHTSISLKSELFEISGNKIYSNLTAINVDPVNSKYNLYPGDVVLFDGSITFEVSQKFDNSSTSLLGEIKGGDLLNGMEGFFNNRKIFTVNQPGGFLMKRKVNVNNLYSDIDKETKVYFSNGGYIQLLENAESGDEEILVSIHNKNLLPGSIGYKTSLVIWGGDDGFDIFNDGGIYDLKSDQWNNLNINNAPTARTGHTAILVNNEHMIVWGGEGLDGLLGNGGRYSFSNKSWKTLPNENAPTARYGHTAISANGKMIIWGGVEKGGNLTNTGAIYDMNTSDWVEINLENAPSPRKFHTATWSGTEMIVYGGEYSQNSIGDIFAYNPEKNIWRTISLINSQERHRHFAVWTGMEILVYGGKNRHMEPVNSLQKLNLNKTWYYYGKD